MFEKTRTIYSKSQNNFWNRLFFKLFTGAFSYSKSEQISKQNTNELRYKSAFVLNPKGGGGGPKVPAGQEIACHFSKDHAMVTKILDFIHNHPN